MTDAARGNLAVVVLTVGCLVAYPAILALYLAVLVGVRAWARRRRVVAAT